ncbi:MAG TPA: NfeD family protein [Acidimicrobiales bacterium]|jgi:membrane protein implicated in regulation of membrane protease activity|nr:NfeD family protein [Acidimicrobiales bacterium]
MDFSSPELWRWIWLVFAVGAAVGEMSIAGSFFLAPFAIGAAAAAASAFLGASVAVEWIIFLVGSIASFAALRPLARRLDAASPQSNVGAQRWSGRQGLVVRDIPGLPGETGMIRLDREEWRAESLTGQPIRAGSTVLVSRVDGTRLVVIPLDEPDALPSQGV